MPEIVFLHHCYIVPRPKVGVKVGVNGQGQGHMSRSRSTFWRAVVDFRGSALPSATQSNRSHYQSKVFARRRSIGVLIL